MTEALTTLVVALLGALASIGAGGLGVLGWMLRRIGKLDDRNRELYGYVMKLRDHIYRGDPPPPPAPDDLSILTLEGA